MNSKKNSRKKSSSSHDKTSIDIELWLLGNINAVVKISKAILNLDKAILKAKQEIIPSLAAKKSLFDTANSYLLMARDILSNISSNSSSIPSINIDEIPCNFKSLTRESNTMVLHAICDIDYAKSSIYNALENLSSRKQNLRDDFKQSLEYLNLATQYLLLGIQASLPKGR
jgi:hypothetical protein